MLEKIFGKWFLDQEQKEIDHIEDNVQKQFTAPENVGGAIETEVQAAQYHYDTYFGFQNQYLMQNYKVANVAQLIDQYRTTALMPEVDNAINEIVNQAIVLQPNVTPVKIDLDETNFSDNIKEKIIEEFETVLDLYDFNRNGAKLFRKWYVDSRLYFHKILSKNERDGIAELRLLNPKKMQFFRDILKESTGAGVDAIVGLVEYFVYDDQLDQKCANCTLGQLQQKLKIPAKQVVYAHSGLTDNCDQVIGYLHRAIKLQNMLNMLQDALAIYRIARAPERRVFYIDVGNLPPAKAQEQVNRIMQSVKNRTIYNSADGTVSNQYNNMNMMEDFWLTRRDGNAKTEVQALPGAQQLGETGDIEWISQKLYEALRIPLSRIPNAQNQSMFTNGSEITRDELQFQKFVNQLQQEFSKIFFDPLETQSVIKKIITQEEWEENKSKIKFVFSKDSFFEEMKLLEVLDKKFQTLQGIENYLGKMFSYRFAYKNIFNMTEDEVEEQLEAIKEEKKLGLYNDISDDSDDFDHSQNNSDSDEVDNHENNKSDEKPDDNEEKSEEQTSVIKKKEIESSSDNEQE